MALRLNMEVFGEHIGQAQPADTISGGKGYYAALALACPRRTTAMWRS
jgi:hypothetical protein